MKQSLSYEAALDLVGKQGFSVIPLRRDKKPLLVWQEFQTRLPSDEELEEWFLRRWPDANLGIVTGALSGLVVVDADGEAGLAWMKRHLPVTGVYVRTGRGWHGYFRHPGGTVRNRGRIAPEVDIRADGGYVVAPPSLHACGTAYAWLFTPGLGGWDDLEPYRLKEGGVSLAGIARSGAESRVSGGGLSSPVGPPFDLSGVDTLLNAEPVEQGQRNVTLARLAGRWFAQGMDAETCLLAALGWNSTLPQPLDSKEVRRTVESIRRADIRHHPERTEWTGKVTGSGAGSGAGSGSGVSAGVSEGKGAEAGGVAAFAAEACGSAERGGVCGAELVRGGGGVCGGAECGREGAAEQAVPSFVGLGPSSPFPFGEYGVGTEKVVGSGAGSGVSEYSEYGGAARGAAGNGAAGSSAASGAGDSAGKSAEACGVAVFAAEACGSAERGGVCGAACGGGNAVVSEEESIWQEELLHPGGLLEALMEYTARASAVSHPVFALAGAVAAVGTLAGQKWMTETGLRTNMYCFALGYSGAGKDSPQSALPQVFQRSRAGNCLGGNALTSDAALLRYLQTENRARSLFLLDEIGLLLTAMKRPGSYAADIPSLLMKLFSGTDRGFVKHYANSVNDVDVRWHHLSLYGASTPDRFWDSLTRSEATDGFLARCLIFESRHEVERPRARTDISVPAALLDAVNALADFMPPMSFAEGNLRPLPTPILIGKTEEAERIFYRWADRYHELRNAHLRDDEGLASVYGRAAEHAHKLALIHAISLRGAAPEVVDAADVAWACALTDQVVGNLARRLETSLADSEFQKFGQRVMKAVRNYMIRHPASPGAPRWYIENNLKGCRSALVDEVLLKLQRTGDICLKTHQGRAGPVSLRYCPAGKRRDDE